MVMQSKKSTFNFAATVKAAAERPAEPITDFTSLPGGITGGVAKLKTAQLGTYKKGPTVGKRFLRLMGVVLSPKTAVRTVKVWKPNPAKPGDPKGIVEVVSAAPETIEGRQTSVMFPLCETKNSAGEVTSEKDNVDAAMNQLKLIIGDEAFASHFEDLEEDADEATVWKKVDQLLKNMEESTIHVQFGTRDSDPTKQYPNPRVFETWYKSIEFDNAGQPADAVTDATGDDDDSEANTESSDEGSGDEGGDAEVEASGDDDLEALAASADQDNDDDDTLAARKRITALAEEAGVTAQEVKDAESWAAIVALIEANRNVEEQHGEAEEAEEPEEVKPTKGSTWMVKLPDPKNNWKPFKKASQVQIVSVNEKAKTVTVKDVDTKKVINGKDKKPWNVGWDKLEADE